MNQNLNLPLLIAIAFVFVIVVLFRSPIQEETSFNSWQDVRNHEFQLIKPIDFDDSAEDVLGQNINKEWYLINKSKGAYLVPVKLEREWIKNLVNQKYAIVDTISYSEFRGTAQFEGLRTIKTMEILCPKNGFSVVPIIPREGIIEVSLKETKN